MTDPKIECPHCHKSIRLTETLAAPFIEEMRSKLEKDWETKEEDLAERRKALSDQEKAAARSLKEVEKDRAALAKQKEQIDDTVAELVAERMAALEREAIKKANKKFEEKIAKRDEENEELRETLKEQDQKLAEAQKEKKEALRLKREYDQKNRDLDLIAEEKATALLVPAIEKAVKDAEAANRMPLLERDKKITDLTDQLADMQRRLEQGSQQLQGEVQELDLERSLRSAFSRDTVEGIASGKFGADISHRVLGPTGHVCGSILWESKRTKEWKPEWLAKVRQDQRDAKADIAVIVTQTMPAGVDTFTQIEGVWVTCLPLAVPVAMILRAGIMETADARSASEGQQTKTALLYKYLTGPEFKQRIEAILEGYVALKDELEREKRATLLRWKTREKRLELVIGATTGMYGDLRAIAGKTLPKLEAMEVKLLGDGTDAEQAEDVDADPLGAGNDRPK
jgi:hypothetical protein